MKIFRMTVALGLCFVAATSAFAQSRDIAIIPAEVAQRHGLHRAWIAQAQVDISRDKMVGATLHGDGLFVVTQHGWLQMFDAETGATRWTVQFGESSHPVTGPGAGDKYVAITKGSHLFVAERATGHLVLDASLMQVATAAPAVLGDFVYVPMLGGKIATYDMKKPRGTPWFFRGGGQIYDSPLAVPNLLAWGTTKGAVYGSSSDVLGVRFHFSTGDEIVAPLSYQAPHVFVASRDGYVYAINELTGRLVWRFGLGDPVVQQPVPLADSVFALPEARGIYCISITTGLQKWFAPSCKQFLAASPRRNAVAPAAGGAAAAKGPALARVYVSDERGDTLILDAGSGARLGLLPTSRQSWRFTNTVNDRLYVGTTTGLIQCLHEIGLDQPHEYNTLPAPAPGADAAGADGQPAEAEPVEEPAAEANPFEE